MRIIGIDPGSVSGAYALLDSEEPRSTLVDDLPLIATGKKLKGKAF